VRAPDADAHVGAADALAVSAEVDVTAAVMATAARRILAQDKPPAFG
jgi:hypothetical protein